jgi:PPK2 family polyphosphate:nucleotide phosphotransferase
VFESPYLIEPGSKVKIKKLKTSDIGKFKDKDDAIAASEKNLKRMDELQEVLYAERKHALLIVLQAMDAGGKDGAIEHVFSGINPQGCQVTSFKAPTQLELSHDFLWRIHNAVPEKGMIGIFNRSHYESLLVERVRKLAPKDVWKKRFDHINHFEQMLADEGTTIIKFFLHISKDEQKERLQARLDDKNKNWKFNPADLAERERWDDYMEAFEDVLQKCSKPWAPWYVVPADKKWFRNWVLSETIVKTLEGLNMRFPEPPEGLDKIKIK